MLGTFSPEFSKVRKKHSSQSRRERGVFQTLETERRLLSSRRPAKISPYSVFGVNGHSAQHRNPCDRQKRLCRINYWDPTNKMETIELKPKPVKIAIKVFVGMFIYFFLMKILRYGMFEVSEIWLFLRARAIEALVATATFSLVAAIPYFQGRFNVRLTDTTLQAPIKKRRFGVAELNTLDLSEISVNRSLRDRLIGTQVVTADGEPLQIRLFFYDRKSISKLLDDIERRQKI
jgi:hypothetical protein